MRIKIKKFRKNAIIPTYATEYSAGADLCACITEEVSIPPHKTITIYTGIGMEIPVGYVGMLCARSGLASKRDLAPANKVGIIDSDYRGEIAVALHNHGEQVQTIKPNERIAQLVIVPYLIGNWEVVDSLNNTERSTGGFGSTGESPILFRKFIPAGELSKFVRY